MSKVHVVKPMPMDVVRKTISEASAATKIYIGSDSSRFKKNGVWYAEFTTVVVIHKDGNRGGRVFGHVERDRDYDQKKNKPATRLMGEVIRTASKYLELMDVLEDRYVEIHMDISPDMKNGSSCVIDQAIGYIRGMCHIDPLPKPEAWAATYVADRFTEVYRKSQDEYIGVEYEEVAG